MKKQNKMKRTVESEFFKKLLTPENEKLYEEKLKKISDKKKERLILLGDDHQVKSFVYALSADISKDIPYIKGVHNYWSSYNGEKTVFVKNIDRENMDKLIERLKEWTDDFPFKSSRGKYDKTNEDRAIYPSEFHLILGMPDTDFFNEKIKNKDVFQKFEVLHLEEEQK